MLKIKFIGTGSAKVSLRRNFTSLLLDNDNEQILIDCGDGISRSLLQQNVELNSINKILITHLHSDHFSGLSTLLTQFKLNDRSTYVEIISCKENIPIIKSFLFNSFIIPERLNFEIRFVGFDFDDEVNLSDNLKFIARKNSHLKKYEPFQQRYNLSLASPSFLFTFNKSKILYSSDIGSWEDLLLFSPPLDVFICEITHIEITELKGVIEKLNPIKTYLIHISEEKEAEIKMILNQNKNYFGQINLATDGQEIVID